MRILFFGDSITQGFWDVRGGWAQRLINDYHGKNLAGMLSDPSFDGIEGFNLGISGDTSTDLLERFEHETRVRRWKNDPLLLVFMIGINDARLQQQRVVADVYDFQENLEKLLDRAADLADGVLCVGLTAVDEANTDPWPYSGTGAQWSNNRINAFEDTVKQTASRMDIPFVPVHDQFLAALEAGQELLSDGLHPNEAGHQLIAELVRPTLDEVVNKLS
jgi:lysophospholipase L1-like esterase